MLLGADLPGAHHRVRVAALACQSRTARSNYDYAVCSSRSSRRGSSSSSSGGSSTMPMYLRMTKDVPGDPRCCGDRGASIRSHRMVTPVPFAPTQVRPISVLRLWISAGLIQAES